MADSGAAILAALVDSVMKPVGALIKRQFNYLCCFRSNISDLEDEGKKLDNVIQELQARVDAATNNVEDITPTVATWLTNSENYKEETNRILTEAQNVESSYLRVATRFSLSRKAVKRAAEMVQKQLEISNTKNVSLPPRIAASRAIPLGTDVYEFESRKQIEEDIMTALRDGKKNMIGICGMGGLGKTTMAKRIMNRVLEEHVFDEAVMAVISQKVDDSKIQHDIGGSLGLKLKDEAPQARILKLHDRLTGTKKILLVLDDIWDNLNLNDLGIPCGDESKGCTILITSRDRVALNAMDVKEVFGMTNLSEEDAWFLFIKKAGTCVDDTKLKSTAKQVAIKCNGLPIALATVGAALKNEKDLRVWKNALKQLRKPNPNDLPYFIAQVYNPVMVSYDRLNPEEAKSLLLCCMFPEDFDISINSMTYICMGLRPIEDMGSLEEERDRIWTLFKSLKSRSLLLDSKYNNYVKMHDVARDVCVFIAKQKGYLCGNDSTWVSSLDKIELPAPNLNLLLLIESSIMRSENSREFKIDETFFEGIRKLKVLSIQRYALTSLPHTTQSLRNLRTLRLNSCDMESISLVGDLVNLEILVCTDCNSVKELPPGIKRLNRLKLLNLSGCKQLQSIGRGIISSLVGLEELKMVESFNKWEGDDGERENAGVRELELLTNLTCLKIHIADPTVASQNLQLSSKLERYDIRIAPRSLDYGVYNKNLALHLEIGTKLGHWIEVQLLRDTESLYLSGNGAYKLDYKKMQNLQRLRLEENRKEDIWDAPISMDSLPNFKELRLFGLVELKQLFSIHITSLRESSYASRFANLSFINIHCCHNLQSLGQFFITGKDCLSQLERIEIMECEKMEQVFLWSKEDQNKNNNGTRNRHVTKVSFPKLKILLLNCLPNLTTFCQGVDGLESPLLVEMKIHACPRMKNITSTASQNDGSDHNIPGEARNADVDDDAHHCFSHLFCQSGNASFSSLKKLTTDRNPLCGYINASSFSGLLRLQIIEYHDGISLCTSLVAENLVNLRKLYINNCEEMVQVIKDDMEKVVRRHRPFPKLQKLRLKCLPKLVAFCECDVELPSLKYASIKKCPNMTSFTQGSLVAPNWEALKTDLDNHLHVGVNVLFQKMKKLSIYMIEVPLCRFKISVSLFNGLEQLSISWYTGNMSLFTSSTAGNLVNLRKLHLSFCYHLLKVIADEEEDEEVGNLPIFRNLQELTLSDLHRLVTFWEWKGKVEWPSLRRVNFSYCPVLANITLGPLATLNLESVCIDNCEYGATNDVNGLLLQQATLRQLEETHEEVDEFGEEEELGEEDDVWK